VVDKKLGITSFELSQKLKVGAGNSWHVNIP
jgi:hypothetical protein